MDDIRERLLGRDYLYDDAGAYRAGVEAALAAVLTDPALTQSDADPQRVVAIK